MALVGLVMLVPSLVVVAMVGLARLRSGCSVGLRLWARGVASGVWLAGSAVPLFEDSGFWWSCHFGGEDVDVA